MALTSFYKLYRKRFLVLGLKPQSKRNIFIIFFVFTTRHIKLVAAFRSFLKMVRFCSNFKQKKIQKKK